MIEARESKFEEMKSQLKIGEEKIAKIILALETWQNHCISSVFPFNISQKLMSFIKNIFSWIKYLGRDFRKP